MSKDKVNKLVIESVSMLNSIGIRFDHGEDWTWCRGMLRHHIGHLIPRIKSEYDAAYVIDHALPELRDAVLRFWQEMKIAGTLDDQYAIQLISTGLLILPENDKQ